MRAPLLTLSLCLIISLVYVKESYASGSVNEIFESLNKEERGSYMQYLLHKALNEYFLASAHFKTLIYVKNPFDNFSKETLEKFEKIELPEKALEKILYWLKHERDVPLYIMRALVSHNQYCYPYTHPELCINIDDEANNCCPF